MKHSKAMTRKVDPKVLTRVMARQAASKAQTMMQGACTVEVYTASRPMAGREFLAVKAAA
jgi:hypothetical protein